ncbi:MAG: InlB B-repeat-containing protein [Erysipelotrichaceae bacterium]|nr:InlB B-repeat-containing protein [Erysipelotrichaceae bacterium]
MFNKKNSLVKFLILSLIALMLVPNAVSRTVNAEEEEPGIVTVKEGGTAINSEDDFTKLTLTTTTVVTNPELQTYSGDFLNVGNKGLNLEKAAEGEDPIIYTITYPAELNYFNIPVTVQLQAEVISEGEVSSGSWIKLWIDGATGLVKLGMKGRYGATIRWTITLLDPEDNSFFPVDVVFGFKDPDESHYLFDTTQRDIYYLSLDGIAEYYELANDGLYRLSKRGGPDRYTSKSPAPDFNNSNCFYMDMKGTFTFDTFTFTQGAYVVPYFYSRKYNITYDLNDDDGGPKATPAKDNPTEYAVSGDPVEIPNEPSRPGYKFVGWTREDGSDNQVDPWESGDKEFVAQWEPLPYKILYDPNVPEDAPKDAKLDGEMEPDNYTGADLEMPSKNEWTYTLTGYKLIGYTYEDPDSGDVKELKADEYRPELLADDNGEITLYAQWEPLPYKILYDPNVPEGEKVNGEMEPDNYTGADSTMPSKEEWTYSRDYYELVGYTYEDPDSEDIKKLQADEYRPELLGDDNGEITLYAQWEPWPYHIAYDANGGEGHIPTQDFVYEKEPEDPWNSETNNDRFTRKGYKFIGFKYQDENGEWSDLIPPTGVEDFYDYLVNVLKIKDSTVTLYAQWQKNPVAPYALPVTGIDRH